jgi:hypothetical protein
MICRASGAVTPPPYLPPCTKTQTANDPKLRDSAGLARSSHGRHRNHLGNVARVFGLRFLQGDSTAYGVEAYAGAHLKRYFPAEFLAVILSNGKGFYSTLAYTLECRRLGIGFASPDANVSRCGYFPEQSSQGARIRVPLLADIWRDEGWGAVGVSD